MSTKWSPSNSFFSSIMLIFHNYFGIQDILLSLNPSGLHLFAQAWSVQARPSTAPGLGVCELSPEGLYDKSVSFIPITDEILKLVKKNIY